MEEQAVTLAKSLGWNVSGNSNGNYTIEIPGKSKKLLLKKEKSDEWLLVSNEKPQAILKALEASDLIKDIENRT